MTVIAPDAVCTPQGLKIGHTVVVEDGSIIGVDPAGRHPVDVALPGRVLLPGLVNAHSHAFQRAFRGHVQWRAAGSDDFWSWRDRMYAVANGLDPEGVQAVSALAFLEMALAGVTHVGEFHYLHHQADGTPYADPDELAKRVIAAATEVGIRITLLRVAYARGGPGAALRPDQARFADCSPADVLDALARLQPLQSDPRVRLGLAAHSVRALDASWLAALSAWPGVVHAHVSEQPAENEACLAEHGRSPTAVLEHAGLVHDRFTAVHLTWPLQGDVDRLAAAGARVCVCPTTEQDLGDGWLPMEPRLRLPLCVGSDSHARIDLFEEARCLELHGRAVAGRRNVLAPEGEPDGLAHRLLQSASAEGARALGGAGGGIAVGQPADLVAVDLRRTAADGVPPLQAAAFVATPEWVDHVWVAGRAVVVDGAHPRQEEIRRAAAPHLSRAAV
ncbi:MAG: formimidoylglutamate deiminase [Myxococcales bacterium]|nr:formimidoylglutamate deiminase [Myxococcales bacterium]